MPRINPTLAIGFAAAGAGLLYLMSQDNVKTSDKLSFLQKFGPIDEQLTESEGLVLGVLTAWAAMESAYGTSKLALDANNLFGIKAGPTWKGEGRPYIDYQTKEYEDTPDEQTIVSSFRKYGSWLESAQDALKVLSTDFKTGGALAALKRGDVGGFLRGIAASGYSTASNYAQRIENFMSDIAKIG